MRVVRLLRRLVGGLLLVLPLVPLPLVFGEIRGLEWTFGPVDWLLGSAIVLGAALVAQVVLPEGLLARLDRPSRGWRRVPPGAAAAAAALLLAGVLAVLATYGFHRRPHLIDDVVQLFQAEIFASGRLRAPAPPIADFFATQHMLLEPGGWYSQYPPGHAALLALGLRAGAAWLVPVVLSVASALWIFAFARRAYGRRTGLVCLGLTMVSPFFLFLGASFMNHVSGLASAAAATWALGRALEPARPATPRPAWLVVCFAALGVGFLSRPLTATAIAIAFGLVVLAASPRARTVAALVPAGVGFVAVASLLFAYNAATTGDPFLPGYEKLWGPAHGLGFHLSPWGDPHTPWAGLRNELADLSLLNEALLDWPVPALWPLALLLLLSPRLRPWDRRLLAGFFSVPCAYFFYWHRDSFLGPRFLYETLPFVLPLTARALTGGIDALRDRTWTPAPGFRAVRLARFARTAVALALLYAVVWAIPARAVVTSRWLPGMKLDVAEEARRSGIHRGLVFVSTSWGGRLIAGLRGRGVPASVVERAYRSVDHCVLDTLLRAELAGAGGDDSGTRLTAALERRLEADDGSRRVPWTADPTLRLRPVPELLTASCLDEMTYDEAGFVLYEPLLPGNRPALDGDVVYARDLRDRDPELCARYPDRTAWLYRGGRFEELDGCRPPPAVARPAAPASPAAGEATGVEGPTGPASVAAAARP